MKPTPIRVAAVVALLAAVVLAAAYAVPRLVLRAGLEKLSGDPALGRAPLPLDLSEVAPARGEPVAWYGYRFEVPWSDAGEAVVEGDVRRTAFGSGASVAMTDPAEMILARDETVGQDEGDAEEVRLVLGEKSIASSYELMRACLEFDAADVESADGDDEQVRALLLLALRRTLADGGETGIFLFEKEGFRGFQLGDPAATDRVRLLFYGEADSVAEVVVTGARSQAELNRVIVTFRRED